MDTAKKIVAYILIAGVLLLTTIGVLGVWGIIDMRMILQRMVYSLLIIFASSAVILFIFSVLIKDDSDKKVG